MVTLSVLPAELLWLVIPVNSPNENRMRNAMLQKLSMIKLYYYYAYTQAIAKIVRTVYLQTMNCKTCITPIKVLGCIVTLVNQISWWNITFFPPNPITAIKLSPNFILTWNCISFLVCTKTPCWLHLIWPHWDLLHSHGDTSQNFCIPVWCLYILSSNLIWTS